MGNRMNENKTQNEQSNGVSRPDKNRIATHVKKLCDASKHNLVSTRFASRASVFHSVRELIIPK